MKMMMTENPEKKWIKIFKWFASILELLHLHETPIYTMCFLVTLNSHIRSDAENIWTVSVDLMRTRFDIMIISIIATLFVHKEQHIVWIK